MHQLPFVGDERRELVARLLGVFDEVVSSGSPRLVTLEADSGWGKSRLVQELYGRLAAERQESGFWPASILGAVSERDLGSLDSPDGRRKRIFPASFEPPVGAVPEWLWWGISATARQGGSPVNALAADREQVDRFRVHLAARLAELNPETPWAKAVRTARSDGAKEAAWEVIEEAIAGGAGAMAAATVTGVAVVAGGVASAPVGLLLLGARYAVKHRDSLGRRVGGTEPEALEQRDVRGEMVVETARALGNFAAGGIPVALVLEDAHQADETLIDLLVQVLQNRRGPVMIVATAWPGSLEDPARVAHRLLAEVPGPSVIRFRPSDLPTLGLDERVGLVAALLPDATPKQREMLAGKWSNPLALEVGCRLRKLVQMLEDGELTEAELASLPDDPEHLYQAMWEELPEELREALMLAVLATPATASDGLFDDRQWDVDVPRAAAEGLDWLRDRAEGLQAHLTDDATAYAWVRWSGPWLQACHESVHHHVAATAALDSFTPTRRTAYYRAVADAIVAEAPSDDLPDESADRLDTRARMLTSLAVRGVIDWTDDVTAAADTVIGQLAGAADTRSLEALIRLADEMPQSDDAAGLRRRYAAADAHGRLGDPGTATQQFSELLEDSEQAPGADVLQTLRTRNSRARWLGESGRIDEAIAQLEGLLEDQARLLDASHPDMLGTRNNLAYLLAESGRLGDAIEQFEALMEDQVRLLGARHPITMTTRNNVAARLGESGQVNEAIDQFESLLEDQVQLLGADHPDTLRTRGNLAYWLAKSGRLDEALGAFGALSDDQARVLGPDHPHTLRTRINLAFLLAESGRVDEAIARFEALVEDQGRVLGPDDRETLIARAEMAFRLGESGRVDEAIARFEALVEDQARVLSPDHEDTLGSRGKLALLLARAGRAPDAIDRLEVLLEDHLRVNGPNHRETLATRGNLATLLGLSGRVDEAIDQTEVVLRDQLRARGAKHRDTLTARSNLAEWLEKSGRLDEAIGHLRVLLKDRREFLGREHADTLRTRRAISDLLLRRSGNPEWDASTSDVGLLGEDGHQLG